MKTSIIFDGDDTLWVTQKFYAEVKKKFFDTLVEYGLTSEQPIEEVFTKIDIGNIEKYGFARSRFGQSMVDTYTHLCENCGAVPNPERVNAVRAIGESVFDTKHPIYPDTLEVLEKARKHFNVILYTAGDLEVQQAKVDHLGLAPYFDVIRIVEHKDVKNLEQLLADYNLDAEDCWMVGNSLKSDITPAVEVGVKSIWLHTDSWAYDKSSDVDTAMVHDADTLTEALNLIEHYALVEA